MPEDRRQRLVALLSERDIPCPGCGYNLRGLLDEHCPECHSALEPDQLALYDGTLPPASIVVGIAYASAAMGVAFVCGLGVLASFGLIGVPGAVLLLIFAVVGWVYFARCAARRGKRRNRQAHSSDGR